jgi:hypothetical protein
MPVILATQDAEIRRIRVRSQPVQRVPQDPIGKKTFTKIGLVESLKVRALSSSPSTTNTQRNTHKTPTNAAFTLSEFLEHSRPCYCK